MDFTERSTRVYRTKQLYTKEELAAREALCVHEQPAFCAAACPLRLDARELLALAREGRPHRGARHAGAGDPLRRHPRRGLRGPVPGRLPPERGPRLRGRGHPRHRARRHAPRRR